MLYVDFTERRAIGGALPTLHAILPLPPDTVLCNLVTPHAVRILPTNARYYPYLLLSRMLWHEGFVGSSSPLDPICSIALGEPRNVTVTGTGKLITISHIEAGEQLRRLLHPEQARILSDLFPNLTEAL